MSRTYAIPPLIPAAKFRPVGPSTTVRPPVIYSQQRSPTPSTTAIAPEFLTQKRSPTHPFMYTSPAVAPYKDVLPAIIFLSGSKLLFFAGTNEIIPPDKPFPK